MNDTSYFKSNAFCKELPELQNVFTVEDFSVAHQALAQKASAYVRTDVMNGLQEDENLPFDNVRKLLQKAGEVNLLGVDVPVKYGGSSLDKISSVIVMEQMGASGFFTVPFGGQVGIGSLPIVYFGTEQQKQDYLPDVVNGDKIGAYALTEPNAGTDALGIKTHAALSEDETYYIINGEKQWIGNAAFNDFFILYAKVNGELFTAFIVDKNTQGLSVGIEEQKMGLKGSSLASVYLNHVKVPVNNRLGEVGQGHRIALNILNIGRHKISASCLGSAKKAMDLAVNHVISRKQFNRSLSEFPLIKQKIADMAVDIFAMESMVYRTAGNFEKGAEYCREHGIHFSDVLKQFALEASVNKVFASEKLDNIVDEALQLHGGYGYMEACEIATMYRDTRINRIFEGTNEINRLVIANNLLKIKLVSKKEMGKLSGQLASEWDLWNHLNEILTALVDEIKNAYDDPSKEQEWLKVIADFAIDSYALESTLLRTEKLLLQESSQYSVEHYLNSAAVFAAKTTAESVHRLILLDGETGSALKRKGRKLMDKMETGRESYKHRKRKIADEKINFVCEGGKLYV
ncbi:acyl-CoA dehydrogenase family protein [Salibacterium sp. K-3]